MSPRSWAGAGTSGAWLGPWHGPLFSVLVVFAVGPFCHFLPPRIAYFCPGSIAVGETAMARVMIFDRGGDVSGFSWSALPSPDGAVSFDSEDANFFENAFGGQEARVYLTGVAPGNVTLQVARPRERGPGDYFFNEGRGPCTLTVMPAAPP